MPSISCLEFNRLLAQAVESRLPVEAAEFRGHAAECADCRAAWLETRLLDCAVAQWKSQYQSMAKSITPSVDLTDVVLFRLAAEREAVLSVPGSPIGKRAAIELVGMGAPAAQAVANRPRPIVSRRAGAAAAIALAAALCVAFLSGRMTPQPGAIETAKRAETNLIKAAAVGQPTGSAKQVTPPVPDHKGNRAESARQMAATSSAHARVTQLPTSPLPNVQSAAAEAPTTEALMQDAGSAYLNLASEAAQAVTAATVLVPRPGSASGTAPAAETNDRWVDDVSREFEPVSKNLSEAFEFLFEAVPTQKAPAT